MNNECLYNVQNLSKIMSRWSESCHDKSRTQYNTTTLSKNRDKILTIPKIQFCGTFNVSRYELNW